MLNNMWSKPYAYKEIFAINTGLLIVGLILQFITGPIYTELFAYPVNLVLLIVFLAGLTVMHLFSKKIYFFRQLSSGQFAIISMAFVVILLIFMGLTPQYQSDMEISGLIGRLGLLQILSSWYFVLIFAWFIIILGMVILKRISHFRIKKDIPFLITHLGLFIALISGISGSADLQRFKLTSTIGKPERRAFDSKQNMIELSLAIELNSFTIDEYPPKLILVNSITRKIIPEENPISILADTNFTVGQLLDWQVTIEKRLENAASIITEDTINYINFQSFGATCALYVKSLNTTTQQKQEGWVSCGSFMFPYKTLKLNEQTSLVMPNREPLRYVSSVTVYTESKKQINGIIEVNKPLKVEGWKIYQVGYDKSKGKWSSTSIFELVCDPWINAVYAGIWMLIAGAVCTLFFKINK